MENMHQEKTFDSVWRDFSFHMGSATEAWEESKGAAKHPTIQEQPATRKLFAQNVISNTMKNPALHYSH